MPGLKRPRNHAEEFADIEDSVVADFDPEDDPTNFSSGEDDDSNSEGGVTVGVNGGREHYETVGQSNIRQRVTDTIGPQYIGSRISRERVADEQQDHDPFGEDYESDDDDEDEDLLEDSDDAGTALPQEELDDEAGSDDTDPTSLGGSIDADAEEDEDDESAAQVNGKEVSRKRETKVVDREELRKIMDEEQRAVAANLTAANRLDVEKGQAVKRQRQTYDSLLNTRIRLQQGLIAVNSMQAISESPSKADDDPTSLKEAFVAAEEAAITLWNNLDKLRHSMAMSSTDKDPPPPHKPASSSTSTEALWSRMEESERHAKIRRANVLTKWSRKTAALTQQTSTTTQHRLDPSANAQPPSIMDILQNQHLSSANVSRLALRTRFPRSCAPVQAASGLTDVAGIFDDADFYGQLLKELLERQNVDTSAANFGSGGSGDATNNTTALAEQAYRSARQSTKTKKNVDTKASKGRKMRFTVHEQLQNFMAPEDRGSWGDRQVGELFGSLLGKRLVLDTEEEGRNSGGEEDEALRLFRN